MLTLRAIQSPSQKTSADFFTHLSRFSYVYHLSLRLHTHTVGIPKDLEASDISYAFSAIKLWLLLARRCSNDAFVTQSQDLTEGSLSRDRNALQVWNELWPPFENLVTMSEIDPEDVETLVSNTSLEAYVTSKLIVFITAHCIFSMVIRGGYIPFLEAHPIYHIARFIRTHYSVE